HPALWQILVVAVSGSTVGQLAWKGTKARSRAVQLAVMTLGLVVAAGGTLGARAWRHPAEAPTRLGLLVVANGNPPSLTLDDLDALGPHVGAMAPLAHHVAQLLADDTNWQSNVQGTTPAYFQLRGWRAASGSPFTQADLDASAKVVVL